MSALSAYIREYSGHFTAEELATLSSSFGMTSDETEREIAHLLCENKIAADRNGKIGWIYDTDLFERYQALPELRVRQG